MTDLVGARSIADELARLAGVDVSEWQVYRLADQRNNPISRDRERWTVSVAAEALKEWWETSRLAERFANRLRNQALGRHGGVMDENELRIVGVVGVGELESSAFLDAVKLVEGDTIKLTINSSGGFVLDGLAIYHALRAHNAKVQVEIIGVAASMASAIAMVGDTVSMAEDGLFMLHDPWAGAVGNAEDLRAAAEMLDKHGESLAGIYARKSGIAEDEIREMMAKNGGEGTWLNAEEAVELGFVDEILAPAQARLPKIPAAAMAKRITKGGGKMPTKRKQTGLVKEINDLLENLATEDMGREDLVKDMAAKAEIEAEAVEKILSGETEPTLAQLSAFSEVLSEEEEEDPPRKAAARAQAGDVAAAVQEALNAERKRQKSIRAEALKYGLSEDVAREISDQADDISDARAMIIKKLSEGGPNISGVHRVSVTEDERDKWMTGMQALLLRKAGASSLIQTHAKAHPEQYGNAVPTLDPGEFRGMRLIDIARDVLERQGVNLRGKTPMEIAKSAIMPRAENAGLGSRSDFPILLENTLHKMLMAAYETAPDQWRQVAAVGSVQDFRAHPRLKLGSLSRLDDKLENGEFKQKHFPDAEKETISASTFGNIIGLTREAIVNDDLDGFARLVTMLGRAAARSIEIDLFALFELNSGLGPTMNDGNALFDASHSNIASTAGTPGVSTLEAARVLMAQQKDPDDNDFLNLRPAVWVGPIGLGSDVRTAIEAQFDFDAAQSGGSSKFMKPNIVRDLLSTIVDTPRLSGDRWYLLADPMIAPVLEVVFLQGEESPQVEVEEGFDYDGVRWRIRHDYGVGAIDFRGAVTNAGA